MRAMRFTALSGLLLIACLASGPVRAVQPDEVLPDAAQEARARALSKELRCMVCQNQSIDDSDAPLARDLRDAAAASAPAAPLSDDEESRLRQLLDAAPDALPADGSAPSNVTKV